MRKSPRIRIVIVDGYSTGRELARELLEREAECLHLRSSPDVPDGVHGFDPRPYDGDLGYLGPPSEAAEALQFLSPDLVLAGSEWGVSFAEQVAARLGLPTNRPDRVRARRDKFEMIEAARRHGLKVARQEVVSHLDDAKAWALAQDEWPIVVKPLDSAGADGVSICHDLADVEAAVVRELGHHNFMGGVNNRMLLQTYLPGPQFIVNTVSWGARHHVSDIWSMTVDVRGNDIVPGGIHLCDPTSADARVLATYALEVLAALGIENGPAHTELKLTPDGPALIETGTRLMGAVMDEPSYAAAGLRTQADIFADVIADCARHYEAVFAEPCFRMRRHLSVVLFNFEHDGTVRGVNGLRRLQALPSFHAHYRPLSVGGRVWRTSDWLTCGGVIYLVHDDPHQIARDIETIRSWESKGALYAIERTDALCREEY
jgi:biotin carboxylase